MASNAGRVTHFAIEKRSSPTPDLDQSWVTQTKEVQGRMIEVDQVHVIRHKVVVEGLSSRKVGGL